MTAYYVHNPYGEGSSIVTQIAVKVREVQDVEPAEVCRKRTKRGKKKRKNRCAALFTEDGERVAICLDHLKGVCLKKRWRCKFAHPRLPLAGKCPDNACVGFSDDHEDCDQAVGVVEICRWLRKLDASTLDETLVGVIDLCLDHDFGALQLLYVTLGVGIRKNSDAFAFGQFLRHVYDLVVDEEREQFQLEALKVMDAFVVRGSDVPLCQPNQNASARLGAQMALSGVIHAEWITRAVGHFEARIGERYGAVEVMCAMMGEMGAKALEFGVIDMCSRLSFCQLADNELAVVEELLERMVGLEAESSASSEGRSTPDFDIISSSSSSTGDEI